MSVPAGSGYPVSAGYSYTEPAPTPPPTPASSAPRATVLLHSDTEFEYYKVAQWSLLLLL